MAKPHFYRKTFCLYFDSRMVFDDENICESRRVHKDFNRQKAARDFPKGKTVNENQKKVILLS